MQAVKKNLTFALLVMAAFSFQPALAEPAGNSAGHPAGIPTELPKTMRKVTFQVLEPVIPKDLFEAKPKTIILAGTSFCRIEEEPDPPLKLHGLMIYNAPDSWTINLWTKSGNHVIDPGPTYIAHAPIFTELIGRTGSDDSLEFGNEPASFKARGANRPAGEVINGAENEEYKHSLEFGSELPFFNARGAKPQAGPVINGNGTEEYKVTAKDGYELTLLVAKATKTPLRVSMSHDGKTLVFEYLYYNLKLPFDKSLFVPPADTIIRESPRNTTIKPLFVPAIR